MRTRNGCISFESRSNTPAGCSSAGSKSGCERPAAADAFVDAQALEQEASSVRRTEEAFFAR
jgi:hypothetical protein